MKGGFLKEKKNVEREMERKFKATPQKRRGERVKERKHIERGEILMCEKIWRK